MGNCKGFCPTSSEWIGFRALVPLAADGLFIIIIIIIITTTTIIIVVVVVIVNSIRWLVYLWESSSRNYLYFIWTIFVLAFVNYFTFNSIPLFLYRLILKFVIIYYSIFVSLHQGSSVISLVRTLRDNLEVFQLHILVVVVVIVFFFFLVEQTQQELLEFEKESIFFYNLKTKAIFIL